MAVSVPWVLAAVLSGAPPLAAGAERAWCVPGFCPAPADGSMPGGLMYLAVGLVWLGIAGLRRERHRARRGGAGPTS